MTKHANESMDINPCSMNKANTTTFTYGINVPSGRLIVGNDLRGLVYAHADLRAYADAGLLYLYAHGGVHIRPTITPNAYLIASMPDPKWSDQEDIEHFLQQLTDHEQPIDMDNDPLADIDCRLWAIGAMDGDHVDAALARMHPDDANDVRRKLTTITITPGYYSITIPNTRIVADGGHAVLQRTGDADQYPIIRPKILTMDDAMRVLRGVNNSHDFHPFSTWNKRVYWAIGYPTADNTGDMGDHTGNYTASTCPLPNVSALFEVQPRAFNVWAQKSLIESPCSNVFAPIPRSIAPEAIACWIAGADATMHAIQHYNGDNTFPKPSQHEITRIFRQYIHMRNQLWGAAIAHGCTDAVTAHVDRIIALLRDPT